MGDRGKLILVSDICCFDYWVSHCTHFICRTFPSVKARSGHMRMHKRRWFFWFQDVSLRLWYPGALSHWISIRTGLQDGQNKRYLHRLLRQRDSLLEKYLWEIRLPTASNPLGFCHVKREGRNKSGYSCTAKDCRSFSSKAKGSTAKAFCLHLHLLFASLEQFSPAEQAGPSSSSNPLLLLLPNRSLWYPLIQKT